MSIQILFSTLLGLCQIVSDTIGITLDEVGNMSEYNSIRMP